MMRIIDDDFRCDLNKIIKHMENFVWNTFMLPAEVYQKQSNIDFGIISEDCEV